MTEHGTQGQNTLTFIALATFLGGTFSFCDRRRTEDLLASSGGENRKLQDSVLLSPVTFSSLTICRLILEMQSLCQLEGCVAPCRYDENGPWCYRMSLSYTGGSHLGQHVTCEAVHVLLRKTVTVQLGWGAATSQDQELEGPSACRARRDNGVLPLTQTLWVSQGPKCWPRRTPEEVEASSQPEQATKLADKRKAEVLSLPWPTGPEDGTRGGGAGGENVHRGAESLGREVRSFCTGAWSLRNTRGASGQVQRC